MILIVGASGFIGESLYKYCKDNNIAVCGTYFNDKVDGLKYFDIVSGNIGQFIEENGINKNGLIAIICSAIVNIDKCKKNIGLSRSINNDNTKRIIGDLNEINAKIVFFSSEAVFDGESGPYDEDSKPNPVTEYGSQKLEVEKYIIENVRKYLILRVSRACSSSFGKKDIFEEFYQSVKQNKEINCLEGQSFTLTDVNDIARITVKASMNGLNGLYHVSSGNLVTRYDLACEYIKRFFQGYDKIYNKKYEELSFLDNRHISCGLIDRKLALYLNEKYLDMNEIFEKYERSMESELY